MENNLAPPVDPIANKSPPHRRMSQVQSDSTMLRGALKLEVSTSTPVVVAGTEFSIYVVIRNPFPAPVAVLGTETHIPVALSDENWRKINRNEIIIERRKQIKELQITSNKFTRITQEFGVHFRFFLDDIKSAINPSSGPRVAIAVTTEEQSNITELQLPSGASISTGGASFVGGNLTVPNGDFIGRDQIIELHVEGKTTEEIQQLLQGIHEMQSMKRPITLQPGDSMVVHFILRTIRWLTFSPISHTFQIQVRYEAEGIDHIDTIPFSLSIRAPVASSMCGALVGSILGSLVSKHLLPTDILGIIQVILTSMVFAIIIVVAFARQNNVQQVVSVEDFWGGMFIGFLVGYAGESFISSVIKLP